MKANYPGKRILTFAYLFTVIPPKCQLEDNIDISFAPISKNAKFDLSQPGSEKTRDQFLNWNKITKNTFVAKAAPCAWAMSPWAEILPSRYRV